MAILVALLPLPHDLLCLLILPSSCLHILLSSGGGNSFPLWTGTRVSSSSPLTSGFSTTLPELLPLMSWDFYAAKLEGHFSPYLISPLLYVDHFLILESLFSWGYQDTSHSSFSSVSSDALFPSLSQFPFSSINPINIVVLWVYFSSHFTNPSQILSLRPRSQWSLKRQWCPNLKLGHGYIADHPLDIATSVPLRDLNLNMSKIELSIL